MTYLCHGFPVFANKNVGIVPYRHHDCFFPKPSQFLLHDCDLLLGSSKAKAFPLHAKKALGGRGGIAPTHSTSALD
jgi:hypothetical protein